MSDQVTKEHLAALSRSAMVFAKMTARDDLYAQIALQIKDLLGDAVVIVCSFDPATRIMEQRALTGLPTGFAKIMEKMQVRASPMRTLANPEAVEQITSGRLLKIEEGLYELFLRRIPRAVAHSLERVAGIREVYGMGCVAEGECFGGITVCLRGNAQMPPVEVMEALIYQATVAIKRWEAEAELRRSEERYRLLMERAPDPYGVTDAEGTLIHVNESACRTLRYARDALVGLHISEILEPEELAANPIPWDRIRAGTPDSVQSRHMKRGDGTFITAEVRSTLLPGGHVLFCAHDVTQRREVERAAIDAGERERLAVGRDLHDSLGQQLVAIGFLSAALEGRLKSQRSNEAESAGEIASLVRDTVSQTRRMAHGLCPIDMSEEGISVSLEHLASQLRKVGRIECELSMDGAVSKIPEETAVHLYQISQEAASNAIRHGKSTRIVISLHVSDSRGKLTIKDDGSGIPDGAEQRAGLGMSTMRYRADLVDGVLDVQSGEAGTTITCSFPVIRSYSPGPPPTSLRDAP